MSSIQANNNSSSKKATNAKGYALNVGMNILKPFKKAVESGKNGMKDAYKAMDRDEKWAAPIAIPAVGIITGIEGFVKGTYDAGKGAYKGVKHLPENETLKKLGKGIKNAPSKMASGIKDGASAVANGVKNTGQGLSDAVSGILQNITV